MVDLFETLGDAVEGAAGPALAASLAWGVVSVILSPCHLASIPLIVAFINGQGRIPYRRAFLISSLFGVGILITVAAIGVATALAGRMVGDIGTIGIDIVAIVFFVVGLHLVGLIPMPWSGPGQVRMKRRGPLAAFILGLVFGIALGPCTFAFMAPMLGVVLTLAGERPIYSSLLVVAYGIGHCAVLIAAGTFTDAVQRYLNWNERSHGATWLRRICGLLVIAGGVYLLWKAHA